MVNGLVAGAAGGAVVSIVIRAVDQFSKTLDSATQRTRALGTKMAAAGAALTTAGVAGALAIKGLADEAGKGVGIANAFNEMFGEKAPKSLETLRKATKGTVSDIDLMRQANQALLLGIDPEALPEMFSGAFAAAQATGRPVADAISDITTGIGRQSRLILDNLGIIVKAEEANIKYAESIGKATNELTEEERKLAFTQATMDALASNTERIGEITDSAALATQRATAQWNNARQAIGEALAPAVIFVSEKIANLVAAFNSLTPAQQKVIAGIMIGITVLTLLAGVILAVAGAVLILTTVSAPWLLIILAIIAAIALVVVAIFKWKDIMESLKKVIGVVGDFIQDKFQKVKEIVQEVFDFLKKAFDFMVKFLAKASGLSSIASAVRSIAGGGRAKTTKVNDFIIQPGGRLIETHPQDTIFGVKNPGAMGGNNIVINIDSVVGLDATDVSRKLREELFKKISL